MNKSNTVIIGSLAVVVAALLWSFDGTFLRPSLYSLPSTLVVFLEHTLGFIVLLPFLFIYRRELKVISKKRLGAIFWVALFGGALGTTFFTKALFLTGFVDTSVPILLQKFQPIFAITLAAIFLRERFPKHFYLYAAVALVGGYLVTFKDPFTIQKLVGTSSLIAAYALLAAFAWGSSTTFGKYSLRNINYGLLAALRFGLTVLIMLVPAWTYLGKVGEMVTTKQWQTLAIIVFTSGAMAMYLYYYGLKKIPASLSTLCELAWPLSAVLFDYFINGNVLSWPQMLGGLALVLSVFQVTRMTRSRTIIGTVLAGKNQGDKIGAKTANLDLALAQNLPKGLYLATVESDGQTHRGLLYYGINSLTSKDCLEVHLLDFGGDLYGKKITVMTERYMRFPKRFATVEGLAEQVRKDLKIVDLLS